MEWSQVLEEVRDHVMVWLEGGDWDPVDHLDSSDYADYLLQLGKVCKVSSQFVDSHFPERQGFYVFANLPANHNVWILDVRGPDVLVGATFMSSPKWIWSKFVNIVEHWSRPRNNMFIHVNEPVGLELPQPGVEE